MTWLVNRTPDQQKLAEQFESRIRSGSILKIPGAHDALTALIAKNIGFEALYLSGAAFTASRGMPDLGIIHSGELAEFARQIVRTAGLPLLVDIDTGFGGVLNAARTAKEMVEAGVAAVQIEDQQLPKKCGHLNGKQLVSTEDMVQKIKVIKEVAPSLVVIARTDAKAVEGIESAVKRASRYAEAGADGIFPEALESEDEFRYFSSHIDVPLLANMTEFGKTPYYTADHFQKMGYQMVIYPVTSLRVMANAVEQVFREIYETGTQKNCLDAMMTRKQLYETIGYFDYEALDNKMAATVLPED